MSREKFKWDKGFGIWKVAGITNQVSGRNLVWLA
jgi:hypothetical protein